ncbi:hypothetical protein AAOGI_41200 [Agarivorans albus]
MSPQLIDVEKFDTCDFERGPRFIISSNRMFKIRRLIFEAPGGRLDQYCLRYIRNFLAKEVGIELFSMELFMHSTTWKVKTKIVEYLKLNKCIAKTYQSFDLEGGTELEHMRVNEVAYTSVVSLTKNNAIDFIEVLSKELNGVLFSDGRGNGAMMNVLNSDNLLSKEKENLDYVLVDYSALLPRLIGDSGVAIVPVYWEEEGLLHINIVSFVK